MQLEVRLSCARTTGLALGGQKRHHGGGAYEWSLHGSGRIDENPSLLCHIFACYCYALSQFTHVVTAVETEKRAQMLNSYHPRIQQLGVFWGRHTIDF